MKSIKRINSKYFTESKFQQHSTSFSLSYIDFPCWRDPILQWPLLLRYVNKNRDTRESVGPTFRSFLLQRGFAFPQAFTHVPIKYQDITSRARAEMPTISRDSLELARIHLMQHASIKSVWHYNSGVCYHLVDEE